MYKVGDWGLAFTRRYSGAAGGLTSRAPAPDDAYSRPDSYRGGSILRPRPNPIGLWGFEQETPRTMSDTLTVQTTVDAPRSKTWHYYTEAEHVINWNFASEEWHCPSAINDLRVGGKFKITMAAKDGSMSFDLEGTYDEVDAPSHIAYTLENGREVTVNFSETGGETTVEVSFDPEASEPMQQQRDGWQSILNNFQRYVGQLAEA